MAKVKVEEQLVNAADEEQMTEQQTAPQTLMEQLMQMQKELAEKMAELTAKQAELEERERALNEEYDSSPRPVPPAISNAWKETRTTFLPRAHAGEENFVLVGVNGQQWKVPRGVPVEVPVPLHERLEIMLDQEEKAYKYRMELQEKAEETQRAIMRVR